MRLCARAAARKAPAVAPDWHGPCPHPLLPPGPTTEFPITEDSFTTQQLVFLRMARLQDPAQLAKVRGEVAVGPPCSLCVSGDWLRGRPAPARVWPTWCVPPPARPLAAHRSTSSRTT